MNCKPGDLAIVVVAPKDHPEFLSALVECETICAGFTADYGRAVWHTTPLSPVLINSRWGDHWPDWTLRPLRDAAPDEGERLWECTPKDEKVTS